ncbi:hypothetical protein, partial [Ligilactobacillus salivarius]|uniref:hypothetical protein n=1 Tax=Ligilactobacillus salivarius TaxID=1624 RepID=UPI0019D58129
LFLHTSKYIQHITHKSKMTKGASALLMIMAVVVAVSSIAVSAQDFVGMEPAMSPTGAETPSSQPGAGFSVPASTAFVVSSLILSIAAVFN